MSKSKALLSVIVGALTAASQLELPDPYGKVVTFALGTCAYLVNHDDIAAKIIALFAKFRGAAKTGLVLLCMALVTGCAALKAVAADAGPILTTADAVGRALSHILGWCDANAADGSQLLKDAKAAYADRDISTTLVLASDVIADMRKQGVPIDPNVEAELVMAQGLVAAHAIEVGMRAISEPSDAGAPKP